MDSENTSIKNLHESCCDEAVFERIFQKYADEIHRFLYYKYGESMAALLEDKIQEAFITLWNNCGKVSPDKAKSYLYTVANNLVLNEIKHQKVVYKFREQKVEKLNQESPEFILREKEYEEKLNKALANLTEAQRTAFLLNRIEGKKHKEIAELLGISQKAVEKRIYGALAKLRTEIKEL